MLVYTGRLQATGLLVPVSVTDSRNSKINSKGCWRVQMQNTAAKDNKVSSICYSLSM